MEISKYRMEIMKRVQFFKSNVHKLIEPIAKEEGLTSQQLYMIANIGLCHKQTIGELAKQLQINQANTSTLCKKLEKDGFIIRERSKEDERIVHLKLSDQGFSVLTRVNVKFDHMDHILETIPEGTFQTIIKGFDEADKVFRYLNIEMERKE